MDLGKIGDSIKEANAVQRKIDFVKAQPDFHGKAEMLSNLEASKRMILEGAQGVLPGVPAAAPPGGAGRSK